MPFPVRLLVMVRVLAPVEILPLVMFTSPEVVLFNKLTTVNATDLLMVSVLKVLVPEMEEAVAPSIEIIELPAVKVPALLQFPLRICVFDPAANVELLEMLISPLMVAAPAAVFKPEPASTR